MRKFLLTTLVLSLAATAAAQSAPLFKGAQLQIQDGEKQKQIDADLRYDDAALVITPKEKKLATSGRSMPYADVVSAEYTFGTSPRIGAALLINPLFLFSHSKSHWLNVKTSSDYALLRLDKSNYKLVIAELEKRSHITVQSVGENK